MSSNLNRKKRINYRGILRFEIPEDWIEEYDDEDGGTFYKDHPTSGTLRIKLISINIPENLSTKSTMSILNDLIPKKTSETILLPNKNAYNMFYEQLVENGTDITIYYWSLVQSIQLNKTRMANFSYTILSKEVSSERIQKEIEFVTQQIENAEFETL